MAAVNWKRKMSLLLTNMWWRRFCRLFRIPVAEIFELEFARGLGGRRTVWIPLWSTGWRNVLGKLNPILLKKDFLNVFSTFFNTAIFSPSEFQCIRGSWNWIVWLSSQTPILKVQAAQGLWVFKLWVFAFWIGLPSSTSHTCRIIRSCIGKKTFSSLTFSHFPLCLVFKLWAILVWQLYINLGFFLYDSKNTLCGQKRAQKV